MEQVSDIIDAVFKELSGSKSEFDQESFIKAMKHHKVTLFTGLTSDAQDYGLCCEELFRLILSQSEELKDPIEGFLIYSGNSIAANVPEHLRFLSESTGNPWEPSIKPPAKVSEEDKQGQKRQVINIDQFK